MRQAFLTVAMLTLASALQTNAGAAEQDFYRGKIIRLVVGYSPGGGYDTNTRLFARYFGSHIPGSPAVIVENMPGASSLKSVEYLDNAPTDGTVVTAFSAGLVIQSQIDPKRFRINLNNYAWIGSVGQEIRVCYMRASTGIKTFEQLLQAPHVTFGETGTGSAGYIDQSIMRTVFGVHLKTILGYPGSAEKELAVERGELDGDCISFSSIPAKWLVDKKIDIIYRSSRHLLPGMSENTPYVLDLTKAPEKRKLIELLLAPTVVGRPMIVSRATPPDRVRILRRAFEQTVKDPGFLAAATRANVAVVGSMTGEQAADYIAGAYDMGPKIIAEAKKVTGE